MITEQELKQKTSREVTNLYATGKLNSLKNIKLTSEHYRDISGNVLVEMAERGILHTENPSEA
jgi:hypothetical protein